MERDKLITLVTAAQSGDQHALNELFNAFYNDVYYFALKTVKDEQVACDVTQETFVEIIRTLDKLQEPAAFVTWMKQITYHQCTRHFKKKTDLVVGEDEEGNSVFDTLQEERTEFIPDEALDKEDLKVAIMAMIDELSEEQRAAIMMFYYDELSIKQIAEIQGTNENTVKSRLNYAKKGIKKSVEAYEKKHGIKLHCVGVLPLLLWLFRGYFAQSTPATATAVAEGVGAATGTTLSVGAATATATATVATTATTVGVGAKLVGLPIATKIVAGIAAATIAIGGTTAAVVVINQDGGDAGWVSESLPDAGDNQTGTTTHVATDYSYTTAFLRDMDVDDAFRHFTSWLGEYELPYFNSVDEVAVDDAIRYGAIFWADRDENQRPISSNTTVEYQRAWLKGVFGKEFDFSQISGNMVREITPAVPNGETHLRLTVVDDGKTFSIHTSPPPQDNGDGTYSLLFLYALVVPEQPDGPEEHTYSPVYNENGELLAYHIDDHCAMLTIEQKDGLWVMKSYEERSMAEWYAAIENDNLPEDSPGDEADALKKEKLAHGLFGRISTPLQLVGLPYFSSPDELSPADVCWFTLNCIDNREQYEVESMVWEIPITEFDVLTEELFGQMYAYGDLKGELYTAEYVAQPGADMLRITLVGGAGSSERPEVVEYARIDSNTYRLDIAWLSESAAAPLSGRNQTMTLQWMGDHWQIASFAKG